MIEHENYINIEGWMVTDLGLRGKELMAYAIVYGFSQDGAGWFFGGRKYVADWLGCNAKTAGALLAKMTEKGLLIRKEAVTERGKTYRYQAVTLGSKNALTKGENEQTRGEKRPTHRAKNAHITTKEELKEKENNVITRINNPTVTEIEDYARSQNAPSTFDAQYFFDYYESIGWMRGNSEIRDWRASVRTWLKNANERKRENVHPYALMPSTKKLTPTFYEMC